MLADAQPQSAKRNHTNSVWTDENTKLLEKLWQQGFSAADIAGQLGLGLTRNAVLGKVHRLGLSERSNKPFSKPHKFTPRPVAKRRYPSLPVSSALHGTCSDVEETTVPEIVLPEGANRSVKLMELGPNDCRALLDEHSSDGGLLYCGHTKTVDFMGRRSAYCVHHHARFSVAPPKTRR